MCGWTDLHVRVARSCPAVFPLPLVSFLFYSFNKTLPCHTNTSDFTHTSPSALILIQRFEPRTLILIQRSIRLSTDFIQQQSNLPLNPNLATPSVRITSESPYTSKLILEVRSNSFTRDDGVLLSHRRTSPPKTPTRTSRTSFRSTAQELQEFLRFIASSPQPLALKDFPDSLGPFQLKATPAFTTFKQKSARFFQASRTAPSELFRVYASRQPSS